VSASGGGRLRPLALVLAGALAAAPAIAHEPARVEDEYIKGTFTPAFVPPPPGSYELPVLGRVAPFVLRDAEGRSISTASVMSGKVAVVSFIYTACTDRLGCPLASGALRRLQTRLRDERLGDEAVLLTISFDTERDTPIQLAKYARAYDADPRLWRFMTAPSARTLEAVLKSYGQDRQPEYDERGRFTGRYRHMLKVFLVDRGGRIRNIYSTGFLVPDVVVNDVKTVLRD
jgi:cytochrome oxidase Cu insertion factor (SCO1/SenC/PrrC family)